MPEQLILEGPEATEAFGHKLAEALKALPAAGICIYLHGDLGAGKTSLARGILRGYGHSGRVPSPTYTLVEPYNCGGCAIYHLDLYRLQDAAELEYLGIDELALPGAVLLIEWPGQGGQHLVPPDLEIFLEISGVGRSCRMLPRSPAGTRVVAALQA
jgi:tRNA threonylcarbamoyladenosine biosynthesis protein TsaE